MNNECSICAESFNNSNRRQIICDKHECGESCCMNCFERWSLDTNNDSAKCMYCDTGFTQTQLTEKLSYSLVNKIFNHRAKMMCSREKSLLPSTQPDILQYKKNEEIDSNIEKINKDLLYQVNLNKKKIEELKN
tara:strand:- start:241 stop:642 length:402 start_codon:yes stop_codon:yes gene_type:complete